MSASVFLWQAMADYDANRVEAGDGEWLLSRLCEGHPTDRIALARALVADMPGVVVAKVPPADVAPDEEYGLTEFREGRRAQFRGVTLSRDDLVEEARKYMGVNTTLTEFGDWPDLMANFAMMIAARVALRMTLPPGYVVVPASMIAAATKESEG